MGDLYVMMQCEFLYVCIYLYRKIFYPVLIVVFQVYRSGSVTDVKAKITEINCLFGFGI